MIAKSPIPAGNFPQTGLKVPEVAALGAASRAEIDNRTPRAFVIRRGRMEPDQRYSYERGQSQQAHSHVRLQSMRRPLFTNTVACQAIDQRSQLCFLKH
jgi:hypothetical protein